MILKTIIVGIVLYSIYIMKLCMGEK